MRAFLHQLSNKACALLIVNTYDSDDFRKLQRQGYSALVLAALSRGLQLYNAAAAAQQGSSPTAVVSNDLQQLVEWLGLLAEAANRNESACAVNWGAASQQAKSMEQQLLDSGAHAQLVTWLLGRVLLPFHWLLDYVGLHSVTTHAWQRTHNSCSVSLHFVLLCRCVHSHAAELEATGSRHGAAAAGPAAATAP